MGWKKKMKKMGRKTWKIGKTTWKWGKKVAPIVVAISEAQDDSPSNSSGK